MSRGDQPVAIVLGTRPEIIKLSPVIHALVELGVETPVVHTNQHYSPELDRVFFEQLGLPPAAHNLDVGSAGHGVQTGRMLERLEPVLETLRPALVLVQGDTNSVLAGALCASKLRVPVGHVEAGLRSGDRAMPEELNRIAADHLCDHLYAPTAAAAAVLEREGLPPERIRVTGNTVVDACLQHSELADGEAVLARHDLERGGYALVTVHRAENTDDPGRLAQLLEGLAQVSHKCELPLVFPVHPRTRAAIARAGLEGWLEQHGRARLVAPVGYLEFLALLGSAALALSDSGGVQEEACILGVPCVTLRDSTERPESVEVGANRLAGWLPHDIVAAACEALGAPRGWRQPFGDGRAGRRIAEHAAELAG